MPSFTIPPSSLTRPAFIARFGGVYEHNPWIAAAVFDNKTVADTVEALADALRAVVETAPEDAQLTLLRAHPDLAGRLAIDGGLTDNSTAEQAAAGLDRCTSAQYEAFRQLNAAYRSRFDFPFIIAVRDVSREAILERFAERLGNNRATELREALDQVHRIAYLRLEALA